MTDAPTPPTPTAAPDRSPRRGRRWRWAGIAGLLVVALAGVAVWYFVFRDTAPPEVSIDDAARSVEQADRSTTPSSGGAASSTSSASGIDGTWTVDTGIGDFNVSAGVFTSSFVGYRVNEQLAGVGAKTAYGRTPNVTGTLTIDGTTATDAEFTADLTTLQSDDSRRDGQLRNQSIQTSRFPTATFTLTEPIEFRTVPTDDRTVAVEATGDLVLHGVTKQVTIPLEAKLVDDTIVVTGILDIHFADFGIAKPTSAAVLSVEDNGKMEVQLFFTRQ